MVSNLDRFKDDLDALIQKGNKLHIALQAECFPREAKKQITIKGMHSQTFSALLTFVNIFFDSSY